MIQKKWLRLHGRYIHITCSSSVLWSILRSKNNTKPTHQTKNKNKISLKTKEGRPEGMAREPQFSSSELLSPGAWATSAAALGGSLAGSGENTMRTPKNLNRRQWQMIVNLANFFIVFQCPGAVLSIRLIVTHFNPHKHHHRGGCWSTTVPTREQAQWN